MVLHGVCILTVACLPIVCCRIVLAGGYTEIWFKNRLEQTGRGGGRQLESDSSLVNCMGYTFPKSRRTFKDKTRKEIQTKFYRTTAFPELWSIAMDHGYGAWLRNIAM